MLALLLGVAGAAEADMLVYGDGDRVSGRLVGREDGVIVFQSARFGELRVPETEATVEPTAPVVPPAGADTGIGEKAYAVAPVGKPAPAAEPDGVAVEGPVQDPAKPKRWWAPWSGRLAFSTELVADSSDRTESILELRLERKWKNNELRVEPRYEFKSDNDNTTVDIWKVRGYARHDLPKRLFVQYVPYYELNRQYTVDGIVADYELAQHQIGAGVRVLERKGSILRIGAAETFSSLEFRKQDANVSFSATSAFLEAELELPWRVSLRDRGQWLIYDNGEVGWTNDLEVTKKLSADWLIGVRHEVRENSPELQGSDYTKLRVFFGLSF